MSRLPLGSARLPGKVWETIYHCLREIMTFILEDLRSIPLCEGVGYIKPVGGIQASCRNDQPLLSHQEQIRRAHIWSPV